MKYLLILILVLCSCSKDLTPDQYKAKENKKFVRNNITHQKGWKLYTLTFFAITLIWIDGSNGS